MDVQNYVPILNEYAQKTRLNLKYEDVCMDGPDHRRKFTIRVVLDGKVYPDGVGWNKKEAKQNAAKNALDVLLGEPVQPNDSMTRPAECPSPQPAPGPIKQANYVCWLNEYTQKTKGTCTPVESTQLGPANTSQRCRYVVNGKEFPEAFGNTKKEAKELAAKAVYEELQRELGKEVVDESQAGGPTGPDEALSQSASPLCLDNLNRSPATDTSTMKPELNYIGLLNTYCQKINRVFDCKLVEKKGPPHDPIFVYKVVIDKKEYPEGQGKSAKEAKQSAAQLAWTALQEQTDWDSQVLCRSASEESTQSPSSSIRESENKTETNNMAETTSGGIVFKDSSVVGSPNIACSSEIVKPKRKMAPHFFNEIFKDNDVKNNNLGKSAEKTTPTTESVFLKDYDQIEPIGKGGFGRVFKARKKIEDKNVAVKIVKSTKKALREVSALSDLQHPNIVRYYHAWIEDTRYQPDPSDGSSSTSDSGLAVKYVYIQMELCEGGTLKAWINKRNRGNSHETKDEKALSILQQVVAGVEYIHSKKLIHRDLKPLNILFAGDKTVKIGDFGLVATAESDGDEVMLERTKRTGTRVYMSPEQMNLRKYDKEVDIFALGLIYFELLWKMIGHEKQDIWSNVRKRKFPKELYVTHKRECQLIERMLSEKPEDRPDAPQIASELAKYCSYLKNDQNAFQEMKTV